MKRLLVLLLALVWTTVGAGAAYACSCGELPAFEESVARAEVAFRGTVLRALGGSKYEVRVDGLVKGSLPPVVTVRAEDPRRSSCGTELRPGPLVYAGDRDLYVMQCMAAYNGEGALQVLQDSGLRADIPPDPAAARDGTSWWTAALGVAVAVALATGAHALRRRQRTPAPVTGWLAGR
jgi:hypothetical protein